MYSTLVCVTQVTRVHVINKPSELWFNRSLNNQGQVVDHDFSSVQYVHSQVGSQYYQHSALWLSSILVYSLQTQLCFYYVLHGSPQTYSLGAHSKKMIAFYTPNGVAKMEKFKFFNCTK